MRGRTVWLVGRERLERREGEVPRPAAGELLVRVLAATTCGTDLKVWRNGGHPRMLEVPGPFGHEAAGVVEQVGDGVTSWSPGDRVVIANSAPCGRCDACRSGRANLCRDLHYLNGAYADFLPVPERFTRTSVHRLPEGLAPELGAVAEPLACVLHGLAVLGLALPTPGVAGGPAPPRALVLGAGAIGLLWVSVLRALGSAVALGDPHLDRLGIGAALGAAATAAIDHARPLAPQFDALAARSGGAFDLVVDATGDVAVPAASLAVAGDGGTILLFAGSPAGADATLDAHRLHYGEIAVRGAYHHTPDAFRRALAALACGQVDARPLLGGVRGLDDVEDALRAMGRREVLKLVIRPAG